MDAVKFLKEYHRMCNTNICKNCPMSSSDDGCDIAISASPSASLEGLVAIVEQWAKNHPVKTRQSEFLKMFPNTQRDKDDTPYILPCVIDSSYKASFCKDACGECHKAYWLQEVE